MNIIYPYNNRLFLQRAHDILVIKTCHALASLGHRVFLIIGKTSRDVNEIMDYYGLRPCQNLKIIQIPILRGRGRVRLSWHGVFFFCLLKIHSLLKTTPIDLIFLSELKLAKFLLRFKKICKKLFIYEVHGLYARRFWSGDGEISRDEDFVFRGVNSLITTTRALARKIEELYRLEKAIAEVSLAGNVRQGSKPKAFSEKEGVRRVFYIGQLYRLQGVDILIEALSRLENVEVHLVGGAEKDINFLKKLTKERALEQRVIFHGFMKPGEIESLVGDADALAIPARNKERMPFVAHTKVYEYLGFGKPIVASDLPSIREVLVNGRNAILVEPENPERLAKALKMVLSNEALARRIAEAAYLDGQRYSWEKRAEKLTDHFKDVLESPKSKVLI